MLCLWNLMLPKYNCELHFPSVFALFEVIMSSGIALGTQRLGLSLHTCSEFKYAELSFLFQAFRTAHQRSDLPKCRNMYCRVVFFEALIVPNSTNINCKLNFLYRIIHRHPSSSGSLPPGCRRWVSRRWGRNGGRCRCLPVSQAEHSEAEKRGRDDKHTCSSAHNRKTDCLRIWQNISFSQLYMFFKSLTSKVWIWTAPPLDRRSPGPSTPRSAVRGRWSSWESSPRRWRHVWRIGRSRKRTSPESFHRAPHRAPDRQTQRRIAFIPWWLAF